MFDSEYLNFVYYCLNYYTIINYLLLYNKSFLNKNKFSEITC